MTTNLDPYLSLDGTAAEALEFYQSVLGGEVTIMRYGDMMPDTEHGERVMHGQLVTAKGNQLMASDTFPGMPHTPGNTVSVSLTGDDADLDEQFVGLSAGGQITVPYERQPWGDFYGQFVDRFGVNWHVNRAGGAAE